MFSDINEFFDWLQSNGIPFKLSIAIISIILLVIILGKVIPFCISVMEKWMPEPKQRARKDIERQIDSQISEYSREALMFERVSVSSRYYFRRKGFLLENKRRKTHIIGKHNSIVCGGPGVGKSSFLKSVFVRNNHLSKKYGRNTRGVFLNYEEINKWINNEEPVRRLIENMELADYRRLYLFCDGVDELGKQRFDKFVLLINKIMSKWGSRIVFVISTREKFYSENQIAFESIANTKHYIVEQWTQKEIVRYARTLIKKEKKSYNSQNVQHAYQMVKQNSSVCLLKNPLVMKIYIYILLNDSGNSPIEVDNRYKLYERFVEDLVFKSQLHNYNESTREKKMSELARTCFYSYDDNDRMLTCNQDPKSLFKSNGMLIHETFFEFFVARYYFTTLADASSGDTKIIEHVRVLEKEYPNEFADFITDAIRGLDDSGKKYLIQELCGIYVYMLDPSLRREFSKRAGIVYDIGSMKEQAIERELVRDELFLTVKNQIIFRLGRLNYESDTPEIGSILSFIYENDNSIRIKHDEMFFRAVLKRGCAISASFIGAEDIEVDYVEHMLAYKKDNYIPSYDLANRSHTIVFYSDVRTEQSIFEFRDENRNISCDKSINKRIERLKEQLPDDVEKMDEKQKKKYYFRLFDLATIYTFLNDRGARILDDRQKSIVRNCGVSFIGQGEVREELMKDIKSHIISLIDN